MFGIITSLTKVSCLRKFNLQLRNYTASIVKFSSYFVPRLKTYIGSRSISVAAPTHWKSLPDNMKSANTVMTFLRLFSFRVFPEVGVDG